MVEAAEAVQILPDRPVTGVENVWTVAVDRDTLDHVAMGVSSDVVSAFDDQDPLSLFGGLLGEGCAEETGADN